jgi:hypothetical protein
MTMTTAPARATGLVSFSGHETFVCRHGWLKKAVDAALENPQVFTSDDAMVLLGVGKNMVHSISHWAVAANVLEEVPGTRGTKIKPTVLGAFLFGPGGRDPYLEDPNSLWLLHWQLATNERRATTFAWAFGLLRVQEFTRDTLLATIQEELRRRNLAAPSDHSLRRDIDCFVRTYTARKAAILEDSLDCPLTELGLLVEEQTAGLLQFRQGFHRTLGMEVFAYALLEYWRRVAGARETLSFSEIAYGFASPGVSMKLDENSLTERLERLEHTTDGRLVYTDTAGIRQVYRRGDAPDTTEVLARYYESADSRSEVAG